MSFTSEHIEILDQQRGQYDLLKQSGYMRYLDEPVKRALQRVYNEAVGPQRFTLWCPECVADMVRQLYRAYDAWSGEQATGKTEGDVQQKKTFKGRGKGRVVLDQGAQGA